MRDLIKIPIEKIKIPDVRASAKFDPEQEAFFKATVEKFGILNPILVRPLGDGSYELIGGKHRLEELAQRGESEAECIVIEASGKDALMMHLAENLARGQNEPISVARTLRKALDEGATIEELARVTGHTEGWVKFYISLTNLPEPYQRALEAGDLTVSHIREALRLEIPAEVDYVLTKALQLGWSASVVKQYVDRRIEEIRMARMQERVLGEPVKAPPPDAEKLIRYERCMICDRTVPREVTFMHIVCSDCKDLSRYIIESVGPPDQAINIIYSALKDFYEYQKYIEMKQKYEEFERRRYGEEKEGFK